MNSLIVGGTSGLGLELARSLAAVDEQAIITGRHDPEVGFAQYREFDMAAGDLPARIGRFVVDLPPIKSLFYAAGFYQEGHVTDLSDEDVDAMINVGGRGLIFFVKKLLEKQGKLDELITITSTSQWTPREFEPVYNFSKAGAGHFSHGASLDPRIDKTLVVGPSGMVTEFWEGISKDTTKMMRPEWVAARIMELRQRDKNYTFAKILGATGNLAKRVEIEGEGILDTYLSVNELIRYHRNRNGWTLNEAAQRLGVSRQYYCSLESGRSIHPNKSGKIWQIRPKTLFKIAYALDMDEDELLRAAGYISS